MLYIVHRESSRESFMCILIILLCMLFIKILFCVIYVVILGRLGNSKAIDSSEDDLL